MQQIYPLFIAFAAIWCASASECDHSGALSCIKTATEPVGWLSEPKPTCDAWYSCITQYKCTAEEVDLPSPDDCSAIKSCALQNWDLMNNCYVEQRNCSDLRRCLDQSPCSELADWIYSEYCKDGVVKYCHAFAMSEAENCLATNGNQASCSTLQDCFKKNDNNCNLVLKNQLDLPARCRTFPANGAKGAIAGFLFTFTIIVATRILAA